MSLDLARQSFSSFASELNDLLLLDASDMFHGIISYQDRLSPLSEHECNERSYVHGCISNAYVIVEEQAQKAKVRGHSDAMVIRGLMGIISDAYSNLSIAELAENGKQLVQNFIDSIDLKIMLTPTRANAFGNVVQKIIHEARNLLLVQ